MAVIRKYSATMPTTIHNKPTNFFTAFILY
jgi:hypothetical protein